MASQIFRVGIIGAGWPGGMHAAGYKGAGGFKVSAVADLIPPRRAKLIADTGGTAREYSDAAELIADRDIDVVSICLPNDLHAANVIAAIRSGKHVICEPPPTIDVKQARQIQATAEKTGKVLLYAFQRRFGAAETAARQAIEKGYAGEIVHARASWMRTRGRPSGTGWFTNKKRSGGGSILDLGLHMLDLAWHFMGQPELEDVLAATHARPNSDDDQTASDVEDSGFALIRFAGGRSLELSSSWTINQPPHQQGAVCRLYGTAGAIDVYTPHGATIYRKFDAKGHANSTALKPPRVTGYVPMMRHLKDCIHGTAKPLVGPAEGVALMQMIAAIYKSAGEKR